MMFSAIIFYSTPRRPAVTLPCPMSHPSIPPFHPCWLLPFHSTKYLLLLRSPARPFPGYIGSRGHWPNSIHHSIIILPFLAIIHHRSLFFSPPVELIFQTLNFKRPPKSEQFSSRIPASRDKLMKHWPNLIAVLMTDD
jgi:hypothetical protein